MWCSNRECCQEHRLFKMYSAQPKVYPFDFLKAHALCDLAEDTPLCTNCMLRLSWACRLEVPSSVILSSNVIDSLGFAAVPGGHMAPAEPHVAVTAQQQAGLEPTSSNALSQPPLCQVQSWSSQPPPSCRGCQPDDPTFAPMPESTARLSSAPHSAVPVQAPPLPTAVDAGTVSCPNALQAMPAAQAAYGIDVSRPYTAAAGHMQAAASGHMAGQAGVPGVYSQPTSRQPLLQCQRSTLPYSTSATAMPSWQFAPAQTSATSNRQSAPLQRVVQSTAGSIEHDQVMQSGAGPVTVQDLDISSSSHFTGRHGFLVSTAAPSCKGRQPAQRSAAKESNAAGSCQGGADAHCLLRIAPAGTVQSFVPQALHHLASNCTTKLQADQPAQTETPTQAGTPAQTDRTAQVDRSTRATGRSYGVRKSSQTVSSLPATSTSAGDQQAQEGAKQPSAELGRESADSTAQQLDSLSQQKQQLNAILNSLQLPSIDSLELSSSEDLSFGDIPSEDDDDSEEFSSGTAGVSGYEDASKCWSPSKDSTQDDSYKDGSSKDDSSKDDDAEYKPGGQRASRKKPGKAKDCKSQDGKRKAGRRKGNRHITMKFLEEGGYFDAPIQVFCLTHCRTHGHANSNTRINAGILPLCFSNFALRMPTVTRSGCQFVAPMHATVKIVNHQLHCHALSIRYECLYAANCMPRCT